MQINQNETIFHPVQYRIGLIRIKSDGAPLPVVNIVQKGTNNGVVTNFDGEYSISMLQGEKILVLSYVGFKTVERSATTSNLIL